MKILKQEFTAIKQSLATLDKKSIIVFLSVAVLQTISWYYTSRRFFRLNLYDYFADNPDVNLYEFLFWYIGDFFTYLIIPVIIIKLLLKEKIKDYGFRFGNYGLGLPVYLIFFLIMLIIIWFATSTVPFSSVYPQLFSAKENWNIFFIFECGMFLYMFAWEFIWRGFMLFGLESKFGYYAVLIQMIPFLILHNGKPPLETFGAIIAGILLGVLALRTRSFLYGFIVHFSVMFSVDLISVLRYKANEFGTGISSLINLFNF